MSLKILTNKYLPVLLSATHLLRGTGEPGGRPGVRPCLHLSRRGLPQTRAVLGHGAARPLQEPHRGRRESVHPVLAPPAAQHERQEAGLLGVASQLEGTPQDR